VSDSTDVQFDDTDLDWSPGDHGDTGYPDALAGLDTSDALAGLGTREFPDHMWVEPSDWKDVARQNDENGTWPEDYRVRHGSQGNSHECTCWSLMQNLEIAISRQRQGTHHAVWLSPLSCYAEANPRQWGGSYMQKTLGICIERGMLPAHNGPDGVGSQKLKFTHTLNQTSGLSDPSEGGGPWVPLSRFPDGWKDTARHFRPLEVINPRSYEQIVSLLLNGIAVSVGRSGHAIPYVQVVWRNGQLHAKYADSYRVHRFDSVRMVKSAVGGAYGIVTTTIPDDWGNPIPE